MKTPVRTCTGCGAKRPKSEMIRVGAGDVGVHPGAETKKLPGRGAYLCPRMECLERARRSGGLSRRLRELLEEDTCRQIEAAITTEQKVSIG